MRDKILEENTLDHFAKTELEKEYLKTAFDSIYIQGLQDGLEQGRKIIDRVFNKK